MTPLLAENGPQSLVWWKWVGDHTDDIRAQTGEHLLLTVVAVGIGLVIAMGLAMISLRWRRWYGPLAFVCGVLYTIPSLALFVLLIPFTGFTTTTAEIALVSYTLLILLRNIVAGVDGVPASVKEAADGMGFTAWRRFWHIDLRLALPAVIAGLRIATVTTVGLVTVAGLIGQGGYGHFIDEGLSRDFSTEIMVGAVLSIAMAVVLDLVLVGVERIATPWARRGVRR